MSTDRDVAVVLSGGGMNGILLELGFLERVRESALWPRVGWIYGTSAGALSGTMAALDRLPELERFLLDLQPGDTFRPHRLWQLPFTGLHDYALPATIRARVAEPGELMAGLAASPIELVVCVTDVSEDEDDAADVHAYERTYSSRTTPPEVMGEAVLASAAISALVLPLRVGDVVGTDGGWVRNFPLGHAYDNPAARAIVAFRYVARYPRGTGESLVRLRRRLERFRAVPPVRAIITELDEAERRRGRGEPAHLADMITRLARVSIARNTALEERLAAEKDTSVEELADLRRDILAIARRHALPGRRARVATELEERFARARFPFTHDRALPTLIVRGAAGELALDQSFRAGLEWSREAKEALIARGWALADAALRDHPLEAAER